MESQNTAITSFLIACAIWAVAGVSYKFFISIGFTFALIFWVSRMAKFFSVLLIAKHKKIDISKIQNNSELGIIFLNAIFSIGTPVFFILSLKYTLLSNSYFLIHTAPAWVFVFAALFLR